MLTVQEVSELNDLCGGDSDKEAVEAFLTLESEGHILSGFETLELVTDIKEKG